MKKTTNTGNCNRWRCDVGQAGSNWASFFLHKNTTGCHFNLGYSLSNNVQ